MVNRTIGEARAKRKQHDAKIGWTELRQVTLGAVINGRQVVPAAGNRVWVTEDKRSAYTVERGGANVGDRFGREVWVGKPPGMNHTQLMDVVAKTPASPTDPSNPVGTASHAQQHTFKRRWRQSAQPGDAVDPIFISQQQVSDLLIVPSSGFTFGVMAGYALVNGVTVQVPEGTVFAVDDTEVPATPGEAVIARVELDEDGAIHAGYGTVYAEPLTDADALAQAPAADATRNTLGYIWLPYGMTAGSWSHIFNTPVAERTGGAPGNADLPAVGANGEILIADNTEPTGLKYVEVGEAKFTPTTSGDWTSPPTDAQGALDELASRIVAASAGGVIYTNAYASPPSSPTDGDMWTPSDGLGVIFMRVAGGWVNRGLMFPLTAPPTSGWTLDDRHTCSVVADKGAISVATTTLAGQLSVYYRTAPTPPYVITACILVNGIIKGGTGATSTEAAVGLAFRQSSDGKLVAFAVGEVPSGVRSLSVNKWTNSTTFSASYVGERFYQQLMWFQIADDNTNRICSISQDGQNFDPFHSVGRTDFLTADQVGIVVRAQTTTGVIARATLISWKVT